MANKSESIKYDEGLEMKVEKLKPFNTLEVKVEIDVSDALKGLKAVERQAKKTARALREVESIINNKN